MITTMDILSRLPPFNDEWVLVTDRQDVDDIIRDILRRHRQFAGYYDKFSNLFYAKSAGTVADKLDAFCRREIRYREESVKAQTTAVPTGILKRGFGDCKHYALFNAGVIDSLNRKFGCGIDWCYCFVAYKHEPDPYHVFVSVVDKKGEVWIDPTPGSGDEPTLLIREKP